MFWLAYAITCAVLHQLLVHHYQDACRPSWWAFGGDPSVYCAFVHKALNALSASPLLVAAPCLGHRLRTV